MITSRSSSPSSSRAFTAELIGRAATSFCGYVFLDKELAKLGRRHAQGAKLADKLAQVWLKDGSELWVLLHTEVQGQAGAEFNQRVYVYNYKIVDRFGVEVVSLAVVTGKAGRTMLGRYETGRWGCRLVFEFPVVKLTDWRGGEAELEASDNPFAMVVLAQLRVLEAKGNTEKRYTAKKKLILLLLRRGYEHKRIESLLRFIDWIITLPDDLEDHLNDEMEQFVEDKSMPYVTSWERRGERRGMKIGEEVGERKGRISVIVQQLKRRIGEIDAKIKERIEELTVKQLEKLAVALLDFTSDVDLEQWLDRASKRRRSA
ncbi:MAG: DUF4351 domain-containing protein [Blastocatellia bacterium]